MEVRKRRRALKAYHANASRFEAWGPQCKVAHHRKELVFSFGGILVVNIVHKFCLV